MVRGLTKVVQIVLYHRSLILRRIIVPTESTTLSKFFPRVRMRGTDSSRRISDQRGGLGARKYFAIEKDSTLSRIEYINIAQPYGFLSARII